MAAVSVSIGTASSTASAISAAAEYARARRRNLIGVAVNHESKATRQGIRAITSQSALLPEVAANASEAKSESLTTREFGASLRNCMAKRYGATKNIEMTLLLLA